MKNKLLKIFLERDLKILSLEKLKEYIQFCIDKNNNIEIQGKTSHHHILPKKLFDEYSDLSKCIWNGSHLNYADHYYAHWFLTESIDNSSMLYAFCAMHFKDFKLKRISADELLSEEVITEKMKLRSVLITENNKKLHKNNRLFGGYKYCKITANKKRKKTLQQNPHINERINKKHKETINSDEWKNTTGKLQISKRKETINSIVGYEEQRVSRFLVSYKEYQQTDEYKNNKFKKDVAQSKINRIVIFNEYNEEVYCIPYLFNRFCDEHNLPRNSLLTSIRTGTPLYNTKYKIEQAKIKGYDKYKGWYAKQFSPEMV